jgi:DNA-directed RNA polymerase specialized sigma24 family protein
VDLRLDQWPRARIGASDVVQEAFPIDREVLAMRHLEQPSRAEAALVLKISPEAGAKRSFRALKRLIGRLATMPGGWEGA